MLWIVVDTLRADALGSYGFDELGEDGVAVSPHLDAFARDEAQRFEHAYAPAPWTIPTLASLFSGRWPFEHGALRLLEPLPGDLISIAEAFRAEGWRTGGVMTNFVARGLFGFDRGFERWDDSLALGHEGSTVGEALGRTLEQLDDFAADPRSGLFLFALWFEPHWRYEAHPGLRFGPGWGSRAHEPYTGDVTGGEELSELRARQRPDAEFPLVQADLDFLRGLYQSEVARIDRAFGELRGELIARDLWERALVVVTADHGEELGEYGWIGHTTGLGEAMMRVPLLVKLPAGRADGRRGATVPERVSLVDLPNTVLDLAGVRAPTWRARSSGRSLAPVLLEGRTPERRWIYLHSDFRPVLTGARRTTPDVHLWGAIDGPRGLKWVVDHERPEGAGPDWRPRGRLYDLEADPIGREDLAGGERLPAAARPFLTYRGLHPDPLGDRDGAEPTSPDAGR